MQFKSLTGSRHGTLKVQVTPGHHVRCVVLSWGDCESVRLLVVVDLLLYGVVSPFPVFSPKTVAAAGNVLFLPSFLRLIQASRHVIGQYPLSLRRRQHRRAAERRGCLACPLCTCPEVREWSCHRRQRMRPWPPAGSECLVGPHRASFSAFRGLSSLVWASGMCGSAAIGQVQGSCGSPQFPGISISPLTLFPLSTYLTSDDDADEHNVHHQIQRLHLVTAACFQSIIFHRFRRDRRPNLVYRDPTCCQSATKRLSPNRWAEGLHNGIPFSSEVGALIRSRRSLFATIEKRRKQGLAKGTSHPPSSSYTPTPNPKGSEGNQPATLPFTNPAHHHYCPNMLC